MLLAAALLVSVPSWGVNYVEGTERSLGYYKLPEIGAYSETVNAFGTICVPERIVATQGIEIYDVHCVDRLYSDSTKVARLCVDVHVACHGNDQGTQDPITYEYLLMGSDEPFCYWDHSKNNNDPCEKKTYIDWIDINTGYDDVHDHNNPAIDHRMVAGAAYFYTACGSTTLANRFIYVDTDDVAPAPVGVNGFYGTFEQTTINSPVTVLTQDKTTGDQFLEQVTKVTMPAHRGYFIGNFECVPWRWNTDSDPDGPEPGKAYPSGAPNPLHYPCSDAPKVPRRLSSNAVMFNVGPRDAATGLYPIDLEHPIYFEKETNKRIENGHLIIEAADGTKYNAFGLKLR